MGAPSPQWSQDGTFSDSDSVAGLLSRCNSNSSTNTFESPPLSNPITSQRHPASPTSTSETLGSILDRTSLRGESICKWHSSVNVQSQPERFSDPASPDTNTIQQPPPAPRSWQINSSDTTSGNSSPESIFSLASSTSSVSSTGSFASSLYQRSGANGKENYERNQRRVAVSNSWSKPSLVRQEDRRRCVVGRLVDSATALVATIWPDAEACKIVRDEKAQSKKSLNLQGFVQESLRRSNTSYTTLQLTLWYLVLISSTLFQDEARTASIVAGQAARSTHCGRRMFLSALILASKFIQDRNYTARAWSKITGLPATEITQNEFTYLNAIDWNLHMREGDFVQWNKIVVHCTDAHYQGISAKQMWTELLSYRQRGLGLDFMSTLMMLRRATPLSAWSLDTPILLSPRVNAFLGERFWSAKVAQPLPHRAESVTGYARSPTISHESESLLDSQRSQTISCSNPPKNRFSNPINLSNSTTADSQDQRATADFNAPYGIAQPLKEAWSPTTMSLDLYSSPSNIKIPVEQANNDARVNSNVQLPDCGWLNMLAEAAQISHRPRFECSRSTWSTDTQMLSSPYHLQNSDPECFLSGRSTFHATTDQICRRLHSQDLARCQNHDQRIYPHQVNAQEGVFRAIQESPRPGLKRLCSVTDFACTPAERIIKSCRRQVLGQHNLHMDITS